VEDLENLCREWNDLCAELRAAGEEYYRARFNVEAMYTEAKEEAAKKTYEEAKKRMDEFMERHFHGRN